MLPPIHKEILLTLTFVEIEFFFFDKLYLQKKTILEDKRNSRDSFFDILPLLLNTLYIILAHHFTKKLEPTKLG